MVSTIHSGAEWQPRFAPQALQPQPETRSFSLSPDGTDETEEGFSAFGADGFTLLDAVDIINPLQHIPLIGNLYRDLTGDTLDPFSRVAGSTLFFGPLGTAVSSVNVAMEEFTGRDIGGHMIAFLKESSPATTETEIADNAAPGPTPATVTKPTAAGTDSLDPVTAWAMNEINHRNEQAVRLGMALPVRPYSNQLAQVAAAQPVEISSIIPPSQWSKPLPDDQQAVAPAPAEKPQTTAASPVPPSEFIPVNAFQAEHRASPATLLRLRQSTAAYKTVTFPTAEPGTDGPTPAAQAAQPAAAADKTVAFPSAETSVHETPAPVPDAATQPTSAAASSDPQPQKADQATASGAIPANGSWFTASMLDALGKYKAGAPAASGGSGAVAAQSSLH